MAHQLKPRHDIDLEKDTGAGLPTQITLIDRIPTNIRSHIVAMVAEFVGTFLFLFFAFTGTQTANTPRSSTGNTDPTLPQGPNPLLILYISLSFSVSLAATVFIFYRVSGGQFNPAVTLSLVLVRAITPMRALLIIPAQITGSIAAAYIVMYLSPGPLAVNTSLNAGTSHSQGVFFEMFLTALLILTILMLAVEKHRATFIAPIGIGMSLFVAEMAGVYYTGGSLNPARSLGPAIANQAFKDQWVYWVGPLMGALLASGLWWFLRVMDYKQANPGQDGDDYMRDLIKVAVAEGSSMARSKMSNFGSSFGRGPSPDSEVEDGHERREREE